MYNVSDAYKTEIRKDLVEQGFVRVTFGVIDPDAVEDAEVVMSADTPITDFSTASIKYRGDYDPITPYGTFENNIWTLDGKACFKPVDTADYSYQGYVGAEVTSDTGTYTTKPLLTITFDQGYYAFRGLSFTFDKLRGDHPLNITVVGSLGGTENYRKTIPVTAAEFYYEGNIPYSGDVVDKIEVTFDDSAIPNRRLRIEYMVLGVVKTITNNDMTDATWSRSNDLMNTSIPNLNFQWSFIDENGDYNPDNPEGLFGLLEENQPVKFEFGQTLEDGSVEWILGGNYVTDAAPTVTASSTLSTVQFTAVSHLEGLTEIYRFSVVGTFTLYQLATEVLTYAFGGTVDEDGKPYFIIDEYLKNYSTSCPLPMDECKVLLQLIANAGTCVLDENREGQITITKKTYGTPVDFHYDEDILKTDMPTATKYPMLKTVTSALYSYPINPLETTTEDITDSEGNVTGTKTTVNDEIVSYESDIELTNETVIIEHDIATVSSISLDDREEEDSSGAKTIIKTTFTYDSAQHYARCSIIYGLTGTGKLTLHGRTYSENTTAKVKTYNVTGEDCPVENKLITDMNNLNDYMDWIADITKRRTQYKLSDFGHPELDMGDDVLVDSLFTKDMVATVVSSNISFSGGLSGETELLVVNVESEA